MQAVLKLFRKTMGRGGRKHPPPAQLWQGSVGAGVYVLKRIVLIFEVCLKRFRFFLEFKVLHKDLSLLSWHHANFWVKILHNVTKVKLSISKQFWNRKFTFRLWWNLIKCIKTDPSVDLSILKFYQTYFR